LIKKIEKTLVDIEKSGLDEIEQWCWDRFSEGYDKLSYDLNLPDGKLIVIVTIDRSSHGEPN